MSRCFVGCLGQARKRCSNRWCCGPRNYASDVRPTDPLAAGVESPSQTLAPGVVFCTATAGLKYIKKKQPSDRGGWSLVRHVKCLTSLYMVFDVGKNFARKKSSLLTSNFTSRTTLFHIWGVAGSGRVHDLLAQGRRGGQPTTYDQTRLSWF